MPTESTPEPDRLGERAEALVTQAGAFARWATRTGTGLARRLPGASAVESELGQLERSVLIQLRRRLDSVDPLDDGRGGDPEPSAPVRETPPPPQTEPLRVAMAGLLMRSMEQSARRAREYLYLALLRQLVPDEARILSALADGSAYPVIHVDCRTGVSGSRRLLSYASTVGRAAGVSVPASAPRYLTRLLHLDLVELGEPDPDLQVQYDILLTDPTLRAAEEEARREGRVRFVRATVRISPLGRDLWDACHPREDLEPWIENPWAEATSWTEAPCTETPTRYAWEQLPATEMEPPATVDNPAARNGTHLAPPGHREP